VGGNCITTLLDIKIVLWGSGFACWVERKKERKKERSLSIICQSSKVSFLFLVANELSVIQWLLGFVLSWWVDSFWGRALCGKALCVCVCVSLSLSLCKSHSKVFGNFFGSRTDNRLGFWFFFLGGDD
jgi:hypothetical protein